MYFVYDEQEHTATIKEIGNNFVIIVVASKPQEVSLEVGMAKEIDVNEDGRKDVRVTLNSITGGKADLLFVQLVSPTDTVVTTSPLASATAAEQKVTNVKDMAWLWVLIGALFFFIIMLLKKKNRNEKQ